MLHSAVISYTVEVIHSLVGVETIFPSSFYFSDVFSFFRNNFKMTPHYSTDVVAINTFDTLEAGKLSYKILTSLPSPRAEMGCLKVNERPVIVGGFTHSDGYCEAMSTALVYDSQSNSWNELGSLKFGRANANLLYFEHQLFAFGGVRRGVFDSLSGHCDGEWINEKPLDLDSNSKLPMRLSYPVEQVEVMDLRELNLLSGQWKEMNKVRNFYILRMPLSNFNLAAFLFV